MLKQKYNHTSTEQGRFTAKLNILYGWIMWNYEQCTHQIVDDHLSDVLWTFKQCKLLYKQSQFRKRLNFTDHNIKKVSRDKSIIRITIFKINVNMTGTYAYVKLMRLTSVQKSHITKTCIDLKYNTWYKLHIKCYYVHAFWQRGFWQQ